MKVLNIVIAAVLVAAALLLIFGIPANFLVSAVQGRMETATGYRLRVDGGTTIRFRPSPTVSLRNVTVFNGAGTDSQGHSRLRMFASRCRSPTFCAGTRASPW